jgi:hypothetical protein
MTKIAEIVSTEEGTATVCQVCSKRHNLDLSPDKTVTTQTIRQGTGDSKPCTICGLNVYGMFADDVITGEKELTADLMTDRTDPFASLATVIKDSWSDTTPMIESDGTVNNEVSEGVRWVTPDTTSKERLVIEIDVSSATASKTAEEVQQFLEYCGFDITREGGADENYLWLVAEL